MDDEANPSAWPLWSISVDKHLPDLNLEPISDATLLEGEVGAKQPVVVVEEIVSLICFDEFLQVEH